MASGTRKASMDNTENHDAIKTGSPKPQVKKKPMQPIKILNVLSIRKLTLIAFKERIFYVDL